MIPLIPKNLRIRHVVACRLGRRPYPLILLLLIRGVRVGPHDSAGVPTRTASSDESETPSPFSMFVMRSSTRRDRFMFNGR